MEGEDVAINDLEAKLSALLDWLRSRGVEVDVAQPTLQRDGSGIGVELIRHVPPQTRLIRVPADLIINSNLILRRREYLQCLSRVTPKPTPFDLLCVFLANERYKGAQSEWAPYVDVLPRRIGLPAGCHQLAESSVPPDGRDLLRRQRRSVDESLAVARASWRLLRPPDAPPLERALHLWAWQCVNTRSLYKLGDGHPLLDDALDGDTLALVPYIDLLNHSADARVSAQFQKSSQCYEALAECAICAQSQIFFCYGPYSNLKLLLEYGFTLAQNANNAVDIALEQVESACSRLGFTVSSDHGVAMRESSLPCTLYEAQNEPSWSVLALFKIATLHPSLVQQWRTTVYSDKFDPLSDRSLIKTARDALQLIRDDTWEMYLAGSMDSVPANLQRSIQQVWDDYFTVVKQSIEQLSAVLRTKETKRSSSTDCS